MCIRDRYIGDDAMVIGDRTIQNDIDSYSGLLSKDEISYVSDRQAQIDLYIEGRRQLRDINWYLKRLNRASIIQILATRRNYKLYAKHVKNQLQRD